MEEQKTTFIYGLFDPRDYRLRYIGKSDDIKKRLSKHITTARKGQRSHKDDWVRLLLSNGLEPAIEILEEVSADNWEQAEKAWIADCRKFGLDLTNGTDGGEGIRDSSGEIREKIRQKAIGRLHTEENKKKMSQIKMGNRSRAGTKTSEEGRRNMSEAKKGRKITEEHKRKISEGNRGRVFSEETRRKISDSLMGHPVSEEARKKMRKPKRKNE